MFLRLKRDDWKNSYYEGLVIFDDKRIFMLGLDCWEYCSTIIFLKRRRLEKIISYITLLS